MPQYVDTSFIYSCLTILQKKENVGGKTCKPLTSYIDVHLPSSFTYATKRTQDSPKKMRTVLSFFHMGEHHRLPPARFPLSKSIAV